MTSCPSTRRLGTTRRTRARIASCPRRRAGAEENLGNEELKALFREKLAEFAQSLEGKERFIFENRLTADEPSRCKTLATSMG